MRVVWNFWEFWKSSYASKHKIRRNEDLPLGLLSAKGEFQKDRRKWRYQIERRLGHDPPEREIRNIFGKRKVWKSSNFSVIQILRENNFGWFLKKIKISETLSFSI